MKKTTVFTVLIVLVGVLFYVLKDELKKSRKTNEELNELETSSEILKIIKEKGGKRIEKYVTNQSSKKEEMIKFLKDLKERKVEISVIGEKIYYTIDDNENYGLSFSREDGAFKLGSIIK